MDSVWKLIITRGSSCVIQKGKPCEEDRTYNSWS